MITSVVELLCGCDPDEGCACDLPLGPYIANDGRAYEIVYVPEVRHRWYTYPHCVKCGKQFAEPNIGSICCICLGL